MFRLFQGIRCLQVLRIRELAVIRVTFIESERNQAVSLGKLKRRVAR